MRALGAVGVSLLIGAPALAWTEGEGDQFEPDDRYNEYQVYEEMYDETHTMLEALVFDLRACMAEPSEADQLACAKQTLDVYGGQFDDLEN